MRGHYNTYPAEIKFEMRDSDDTQDGTFDVVVASPLLDTDKRVYSADPNELAPYEKGDQVTLIEVPRQNGGEPFYVIANEPDNDSMLGGIDIEELEIPEDLKTRVGRHRDAILFSLLDTPESLSPDHRVRIAISSGIQAAEAADKSTDEQSPEE